MTLETADYYEKLEAEGHRAQETSILQKWHEDMHCAFGHMEKLPLVEFVSNFCRGFAQVVFLDNPLSGIFIIVAIVLPQLDDFLVSTIVTIVAYSSFYCLVGNAKEKGLNTGLYLYNAVLVGMAIGVFYPSSSEDHGFRYGSLVAFGIAVIGVQLILESVVPGQPIFTFPFNITMIFFLHLAYACSWVDMPLIGTQVNPAGNLDYSAYWESISLGSLLKGISNGFCQVYLVESWVAGVLMFLGMCVEDVELAALALMGSVQGTFLAVVFGSNLGDIYAGLYGYNPLLVTMAIGKVFTNECTARQRWLMALFFGFATFPVEASLKIILGKIHVPCMTFPFCFTTMFFFCIRSWIRQNITPKDLPEKIPTIPVRNLQERSLPNSPFASYGGMKVGREMTI